MNDDAKRIFEAYSMKKKKAVIISGIHGDEPAGNIAAQHFKKLKDVLVIDYVNTTGKRRFLGLDLNRNFLKRNMPEKDKDILQSILKVQPEIVISLHEDDSIGSVYMYCSADLSFFLQSLLKDTEITINTAHGFVHGDKAEKGVIQGGLSHKRQGTLERALEKYNIPHCTIETPTKKHSIEERAEIQKNIVTNILKHF